MIRDSLFYSETRPLRKIAYLFTIPCAIVPIMMATAGLMSIPFGPILFQNDFIVFGAIYLVYFYGLLLSWQTHKNWIPLVVFGIHVLALFIFIFAEQPAWLGYTLVFSIMATSLSNQYLRVGSFACNENCGT